MTEVLEIELEQCKLEREMSGGRRAVKGRFGTEGSIFHVVAPKASFKQPLQQLIVMSH